MRIVAQRAEGDCGVAALSTMLGIAYEDAYLAVSKVDRDRRGKRGLLNREIIAAAGHLGVPMRAKRRPDLDEDEGILCVNWNSRRMKYRGHFVVLYNGMVIDPAGPQVVPHEEWFAQNDARPGSLLERS